MSAVVNRGSVADGAQVSEEKALGIREATEADRRRWNAFADSTKGAEVYHRYEWRGLLEDVFGHRGHYLIAERGDGKVLGVLPAFEISSLLFGHFFVSIPYFNYCGVLAESDAARDLLVAGMSRIAGTAGAAHLELRHREGVELDLPCRTDKVSMQLKLPGDSEALWRQFSSKLRSQIRRPQKEGAVCRDGNDELIDDFYSVFSRNMRDLGTPVFPKSMFMRMLELFPESTRIFVVYLEDRPAAASIVIGYRGVLEVPFASSLRQYNRQAVNMLLYWGMLRFAIAEHYRVFDFGRSTVDSGPHRFKKQWGAESATLPWHYWLRDNGDLPQLNPANPKYQLATSIWRRIPVGLANVLGPRLIRYLA